MYLRSVTSADRAGSVIAGRYRLDKLIGRGAMAEVYRAADLERRAEVAVKILRTAVRGDAEAIARFDREAHVQAMVQHRNVAAIYDCGATEAGEPYLAVELLKGRSLRTVIKAEGKVSARRAASYAWQALQGLAAVHDRGILHRDLKPANLMLEPSPGPYERVVVIDFGFAALEGGSRLTAQGHVVGSLAYLAPERLMGEEGDERSDIYAVGVILYEVLVGNRPFVADNDMDLINAHIESAPVPLRTAAPDASIPEAVERVVLKALAKRPVDRATSAAAMANELEAAIQILGA